MPKKSKPQFAAVEQPFGLRPAMYCPICGKSVLGEDGPTPCDHLAFVFLWEIGEFGFESSDFEQRMENLDDGYNLEEMEQFPEFLEQLGYDNKMLAIEITYGGMACGPVWYTDVFGFDYDSMSE